MAASSPGVRRAGGLLAGWRGLARFWGAVLLLLVMGGVVLQALGPPPKRMPLVPVRPVARVEPVPAAPAKAPSVAVQPASGQPASGQPGSGHRGSMMPGRSTPGPVADPDPALLVPYAGDAKHFLPRVSADGRTPMSVYAAGFDPSNQRPRVGILIAGIGMSEADSLAAIKTLPGGVTLAISPYAADPGRLLAAARLNEHEYLLSVPMEPQGYPVNDPDGRYALMSYLPPAENMRRLQAILARLTGYVGVTNALGPMFGERFAGIADQFDPVLREVAHRGLLFVDARSGQALLAHAWNRPADIVLDGDPLNAATLDQRLDTLTHMALDKGSALGIVSVPRPVTLARVAAWTNTLAQKGVALAPVSALVQPPARQESAK